MSLGAEQIDMGRQDRSPGSRLKIAGPTQRKLPLALPALLISLFPILIVQRVGLPMVRSGWASCRRESGYFGLRYCPCSFRSGALRLRLSRAVATVRSSLASLQHSRWLSASFSCTPTHFGSANLGFGEQRNSYGTRSITAPLLPKPLLRQKRKAGRSFGVFWRGKATDQKGATFLSEGSWDCVNEFAVGHTVLDFVQPEPFCRYFKSSGRSEGMSANVGTSEFFA